jgi:integrase
VARSATVSEWHARWPRYARRAGTRSAETIRRTHERSRLFAEMFGDREIDRLDPDALATWFARHPDKHRYVKTVLNDAVVAGRADRNPVLEVRVKARRYCEHYIPSEPEVRAVAGAMGELRNFTLLAAFSGLRVSEVCALEAGDVLQGSRLRVRDGKGGRSRVVVLFCPEIVQQAPQTGCLFLRERTTRTGWLVRRSLEPWTGRAVAHRWARARSDVGLPDACRFHDLRRFHATWLLDRGASDLDVAVQLGHLDANGVPNAELVRRVYGRPSVDAALERLASLA